MGESRFQRAAGWFRDSALAVVAVLLVLAVAASGWSASFIALHGFAMLHMGFGSSAAWLVPGTFDGAAFGLSLLAFRAATYGRASLGARVYVYGFTALSSWINFVHISDRQGRMVACLLPISAVVVFDKVLREAREAYERRHGKQVFKVRPGLLLLRLVVDRAATAKAIRAQISAIPVEALIGMGAGTLAREAQSAALPGSQEPSVLPAPEPAPAALEPAPEPAAPAWTAEPFAEPEQVNTITVNEGPDMSPVRLDTAEAAAIIRQGHAAGRGVTETAAAATRSKAYVSQVFTKLDRAVTSANGRTVS